MKLKALARASILPLVLLPGMALATSGYFSHGYGVKSMGMAGVGIALPQDGLAAATNPAGTAFVGNRLDLGLTWFRPSRGSEIVGNPFLSGSFDANDSQNFFIPELGYAQQLSPQLAVGVAVYGNGGMNTNYGTSPFTPLAQGAWIGRGGVDLSQLFISPSLAWKINENHALGVALNLAYQRFKIEGVQPFAWAGYSESPADFSNNGYDSSYGWGIRIGYTGNITPELTLGATWASKTYMTEFDKYRGLFAEQGDFDIPSTFGVGLAWKATNELTIAGDYQRILYSQVAAIGNPIGNLFTGNLFGSNNGPGFGWENANVWKIGAAYAMGDWTLRGGYEYIDQPIPQDQTFLNIYAPGVVKHHLSLGATWRVSKTGELSMQYTHAFKETVNGSNSIPPMLGGGEANLWMYQDSLSVAYGWKF